MNSKRFKGAIGLSLALLLVFVLSVFAAPAAPDASKEHVKIRLNDVTIPWNVDLISGLCPGVPEGYTVTTVENGSDRRKRALYQELPNGNKRVKVWDVVTGAAVDNFGDPYTFTYRNNIVVNFNGSFATIKVVDYFAVRGEAFSHKLGFKWIWQYTADDLNLVKEYDGDTLVNVYPDFPTWPTDNGVDETTHPNYVPGSWRIGYQYGTPFGCDPL